MRETAPKVIRRIAVAPLFIMLLVATSTAYADARLCRQLESQLASGGRSASSSQIRKYDSAIKRQREELSRARATARSAGCFMLFGRSSQCGGINAQIDRMEGNLASLESKRSQMGGGGLSSRERAKILASLEANDCRGKSRGAPITIRGPSLIEQIFGNGERRIVGGEPASEAVARPRSSFTDDGTGHYAPSGTYVTMCVRTCDGYVFPVSGSSSARDFDRDQKNCEAMCPGTELQLYYREPTVENPAQLMSVSTQQPYEQLTTANLYRQTDFVRPATCGCNAAKSFAEASAQLSDKPAETLAPTPSFRVDPATDPETLQNMAGGLDQAAIERLLKLKTAEPGQTASTTPEQRRIRVVGPAFLPDPATAADPQAPDQKTVQ